MNYKVYMTDNLPDGIGGQCVYPWFPKFGTCKIYIRPKYSSDIGLFRHELCHADQYAGSWFHSARYAWSKEYRYKCELKAYTEQIREYKYSSLNQCAWIITALATKYGLDKRTEDITYDVIRILNRRSV